MKYYLFPYNQGSESCRALADALEGKIIKREGSRFRPGAGKAVINWGASDCPYDALNHSDTVKACSNKLVWFRHLQNLGKAYPDSVPRVPKWTTSSEEARKWDTRIVARTVLNGHSGNGIILWNPKEPTDFPTALLYVEYMTKELEFRVHVFNKEVIDVQRKIKDPDREVSDWSIRSYDNGFIFIRNNKKNELYKDVVPSVVKSEAIKAVACTGLVFGAVDVVVTKKGNVYVLEVNSAPGCQGETVNVYRDAIRKYYQA